MPSVTGITWNTEPVMARYRALKAQGMDGLKASRVVLQEFTGATHSGGVRDEIKPVTKIESGISSRGRPKKHKDAAARQAAYRGRRG